MTPDTKKHVVRHFVFPFLFLHLIYFFIFSLINRHWGQADLAPVTMIKYTFSIFFDALNLDFLRFDIPSEYAGYIAVQGYSAAGIQARSYHFLLDFLPLNIAYTFFPYFLFATLIISFIIYMRHPISAEKATKRDKYIRGAQKVEPQKFCKESQKNANGGIILPCSSGKLVLDKAREKEHFLILGSTGTGKSSLLLSMVSRWITRGAKLIIVDRKGEFWAKFGRPGKDVLFNPFDSRSTHWSIFNEFEFIRDQDGQITQIPPDLQAIADVLFGVNDPRCQGNARFWKVNGASVFVSALCFLARSGKTTNQDIVNFFAASGDKILASFKTLPKDMQKGVGALGDNAGTEQAAGVLATVADAISQLSTCCPDGDFSVKKWIHDSEPDASLFISTAGRFDTSFTTIVALFLDLIGREVKDFSDDGGQDTRIVFIVDELAALPPLDTLSFLLTQARSKGVAVVLANQTFAKIRELYKDTGARNILACAKSRFFFCLPEAEDSKYIAATIGQAEVERTLKSKNESRGAMLSAGQARSGENKSKQITKDDAFLPADLASLKTGEAVVQLPQLLPMAAKIKFNYQKFPSINPEYQPIQHDAVSAKILAEVEAEDSADSAADAAPADQSSQTPEPESPAPKTEPHHHF